MRVFIAFTLIVSLSLVSCRKDDIIEDSTNTITPDYSSDIAVVPNDFHPLSVGSYWVYEYDTHNPDGTIIDNNTIDTVKIIGDTLIDGYSYAIFTANIPYNNDIYYRRLSVEGEVKSFFGSLVCPPNNSYTGQYNSHYGKSGEDTTYHYWQEFSGYETISTIFGDYDCIQMTAYHQYWPVLGGDLVADTNYFSSIGMLQKSASYSSGSKLVGTLIGYYIP